MQSSNKPPLAWIALASLALPAAAASTAPALRPASQDGEARTVRLLRDHVAMVRDLVDETAGSARVRLERELAWAADVLDGVAEGETAGPRAPGWLDALRPYARAADALAQAQVVLEREPVEDFEALAAEGAELRRLLDQVGSPLDGREERPAALQALLEASVATANAYLASSERQGQETSVAAGVYYLKSACGRGRLAELLLELELEPAPPAAPIVSVPGLDRYLARLEGELLALYQPPLTQERHATFIGLSAGLKFAREMRELGYELGALEEALDVARGLALFAVEADTPAPDPDVLARELDRWWEDLEQREVDVTLPARWLIRAQYELESDAGDLRAVGALFERVLDDYFACFAGSEDAVAAAAPDGPQVTVTLVRWPFT